MSTEQIPAEVLKKTILIREFEKTLLKLYAEGKVSGTVHTCIGQEITAVEICSHLKETDFVVSNHRGHGHYLALTANYKGLLAEILGYVGGCSGGIGGSQHLYANNFMSNGIQGGMLPIAAGISMARKGTQNIVVAFIGDGTLGEGIVYETWNISRLWKLPLLIVIENNEIAQSTSIRQNLSGSIESRARAFDIEYRYADSSDYPQLSEVVARSIEYVRKMNLPLILEIRSYRLMSHSKGDDNRSPEMVEALWQRDLIEQNIITRSKEIEAFTNDAENYINKLVWEVEQMKRYTGAYSKAEENQISMTVKEEDVNHDSKKINRKICAALERLMAEDDTVVLIGEDIETTNEYTPGDYGGAFKVTHDLSNKFPGRVRNTPISEAAITGLGIGLAICGKKPIVEIMFGDFLTLAFDQIIQHASKICTMYGREIQVPLVIRTPMGGGRGYGPTHSQSIEKHFLGIPNVDVIVLNHHISVKAIYDTIFFSTRRPTLFIENKRLYSFDGKSELGWPYRVDLTSEPFPTVVISPAIEKLKPSIIIVCYGYMLVEVEKALMYLLRKHEIACRVICPTLISNTNTNIIKESLEMTGRLLTVEEGSACASWSADCLAKLCRSEANLRQVRSLSNEQIIPAAVGAESRTLPDSSAIVREVLEMISN